MLHFVKLLIDRFWQSHLIFLSKGKKSQHLVAVGAAAFGLFAGDEDCGHARWNWCFESLTFEWHISPVQFSELLNHKSRRLWFAKHHETRTFVRRVIRSSFGPHLCSPKGADSWRLPPASWSSVGGSTSFSSPGHLLWIDHESNSFIRNNLNKALLIFFSILWKASKGFILYKNF